jgi:hypothetical protein
MTSVENPPVNRKSAQNSTFFAIASYVIFSLVVPLLRIPHLRPVPLAIFSLVGTILMTLLFMWLQLNLPRAIVDLRLRPKTTLTIAAAAALFWWATFKCVHPYHGLSHGANMALAILSTPLMGISLTFSLTALGILLSKIVRDPNILLPVAVIAMPIDYIGAMTKIGFTADVVKHHSKIIQHVFVNLPTMRGLAPIGMIGPGDVLFIAFFFAVAKNLNMNYRGTFRWMYGLLSLTMLEVIGLFGVSIDIAALVPMGIAMIAANRASFKLQRSEVFASIYAGALVLALVVAFYLYTHYAYFGGK